MFSFINRIRDYLSVRLRESQTSGTILLALVIGMSAGLTAVVLRIAIESVQWPFQVQLGGWLSKWLGCAWPIAIVVLVKMIVSAITKGSGGSAGREGSIVHIGSVIGSKWAQWQRLHQPRCGIRRRRRYCSHF